MRPPGYLTIDPPTPKRTLTDRLLRRPARTATMTARVEMPAVTYECPAPAGDYLPGRRCHTPLPCALHAVPDWQAGIRRFGVLCATVGPKGDA